MRKEGRVILGALTDQGKVRDSNEDRSFYCKFELPGPSVGLGLLAVVADGMGGHAAGEAASERAIQILQSRFCGVSSSEAEFVGFPDWVGFMSEAISQANDEVYAEAQRWEGRTGMGTTLTAAALIEGRLYIGHVGDSRAYLIRQGRISQITEDDTWTAEQVRHGLLTEAEAARSDRVGQLMRALGIKPTVQVSTRVLRLAPGDIVLLCTDGLTGVVSDQEILQALRTSRTPQSACERLVSLANRRGGPDNIAVIVAAYEPELALGTRDGSPRSVRRAMIAGLVAVLALLAVDAAYLASHYSEAPKTRPRPAKPRSGRPPVTVTVKPVTDAQAEDADGQKGWGRSTSELMIRDLSGEVVTLSGGGGSR